ncbi:hypothetical protein A3C23_02640 [Candidatus Roizmanbacteria bacterium RIFCSPHIGHO2_02_FULL_37_13b]|uniref:PIN domain-containing protein n=1 Tax=Candidatus Roizmanbacteria bacterium RIFCSPLOWO2_02_FULL_36_11 TaxID=1802071 RepID=A0A1F7JG14_9BACT|nr:MAG: hypothetical protein A3C23_02640 [Candidatus Roizmanbacteria bacterium RIFCSPHIGHO2_02_FULL_37_13b]OGK54571.1 MAG: hypothetical protein A3H78_01650 [Candidatus Roizmanbacteria bacterium RIFCSPLOWO2_02_FULL_36_11]
MKSVFIDSSVLVAACVSTKGASAYLLGLSRKGLIKGYISRDVIGEAKKNINFKLKDDHKKIFKIYLQYAKLGVIDEPLPELIELCEKVIYNKDAPILAAAIQSPCQYLVTLDRKHFLTNEVAKFVKKIVIITPGDFIKLMK